MTDAASFCSVIIDSQHVFICISIGALCCGNSLIYGTDNGESVPKTALASKALDLTFLPVKL